jgi:putative methanogenesis marker protein 3
MKITVNGRPKTLREGATLKDAVAGEEYREGSMVAVHLSVETVTKNTNDFELVTPRGNMVLHLDDSPDAEKWRSMISTVKGVTARWVTRKIVAFGSFPSDIEADPADRLYRKFDCFFSLGGGDNQTTYIMVAKSNHRGSYGAGGGRIGRITVGRHLIEELREGEGICGILPVVSEVSTENVDITSDMSYPMEEGYSVDTNVLIKLDSGSPAAAEHILITASHMVLEVTDPTGSYIASSEDLDADIKPEKAAVRDMGSVTVRNEGTGKGRIYIYKDKRQVVQSHSSAGKVERGLAIVSMAKKGDRISVVTDPPRILSVGMTQRTGGEFLSKAGVKQVRKGDTSDEAIIVEQTPELTIEALRSGTAETFGVPRDSVYRIEITAKDRVTPYYFRKVTGLSHKPIGTLKVQFAYEGASMITFYGDEARGKLLHPQPLFKKVKRGDIGITNQARPYCGLVGIRLQDSKEYGPTGEEPYGTNIVGRFVDDLERLLAEAEEDKTIYITEEKI